ncbi:hypothetical protein KDW55_01080 [Burkholderia sp. AU19243]|uniref:hypothetical protein n=1 Tax=Burkholderia sp. AU19243 TaxID=2824810 RepID=UPI001BA22E97|nr:hypothetical protein [Burkholderia sp. AU19243]MBR8140955.1 hypothetical protein [Burkholderia vietnamiensis]MBR8361912.1 hypothetical protein [Burkholderia sp. AU19243]
MKRRHAIRFPAHDSALHRVSRMRAPYTHAAIAAAASVATALTASYAVARRSRLGRLVTQRAAAPVAIAIAPALAAMFAAPRHAAAASTLACAIAVQYALASAFAVAHCCSEAAPTLLSVPASARTDRFPLFALP